MRKAIKIGLALVATGAATAFGLSPIANASPPAGAPATGVQHVSYAGQGFTCTDWINRSASGNVTEWRPNGGCTGNGSDNVDGNSTLFFKPTSASKPASCDQTHLTKSVVLTYGNGFGLYTVTSGYGNGTTNSFWTPGQAYLVCFYPLASRATGNFDWTAYTSTVRHVTFDVHSAGYGVQAGGSFSYTDGDGNSYTVSPTCVITDPSTGTVYFGGPVSNPSNPAWSSNFLVAKAVAPAQYGGSFVTSDPCPTLGQGNPLDWPFGASGIAVTPIFNG